MCGLGHGQTSCHSITLGSSEIPLEPEKEPSCLVAYPQDLADGIRSNYADKTKENINKTKMYSLIFAC